MEQLSDFNEDVRREVAVILTQTYRTNRHGAHPSDRDEFARERQFWPDMMFHGVAARPSTDGSPGLAVTFTPTSEPAKVYGYLIDTGTALAAWGKRIGILNPQEHPSMFAAELVWFMVAFIGVVDLDAVAADSSGIHWINKGTDVFAGLPKPNEPRPA